MTITSGLPGSGEARKAVATRGGTCSASGAGAPSRGDVRRPAGTGQAGRVRTHRLSGRRAGPGLGGARWTGGPAADDRRRGRRSPARQSVVAVPPAAAILSRALAENAWTVTCRATVTSPSPSTLTGAPSRTAPLATRSSTVTAPPSGKSAREPVQVDHLVLDPERVLEAAQLGQPHVQRHLPALEGGRAPGSAPWCPWCHDRRSCPCCPHRDPPGSWPSGARGRPQVVHLERVLAVSSTLAIVSPPPRR